MATQSFKKVLVSISHAFNSLVAWKMRHLRALLIVFGVISAGIILFLGYRWYQTYQDKKAQLVFSNAVQAYNSASQSNNPDEWERASTLLKLGYDQYSTSSFAPYFQSFYADSLLKQNKFEEAVVAVEKAVSLVPAYSPLAPALNTKLALMLLDSTEINNQERGEKLLKALAYDKNNILADQALFYLGYYCWSANRVADAKIAWQKLISEFSSHASLQGSPWLARAQEKMAQLGE